MKVIQTDKFMKLSGATGDDQFPSSEPRHDGVQQGVTLFNNAPGSDTADDIKRRWNKKKKKKKKKRIKEEFPKAGL